MTKMSRIQYPSPFRELVITVFKMNGLKFLIFKKVLFSHLIKQLVITVFKKMDLRF